MYASPPFCFDFTNCNIKFDHCLDIGRDFVHAIQELARISDFDSLWRDMLRVPERLSPRFKSIEQQLMMRPTPVEILNVRLTPNMEQKLYFILEGRPKHVAWTYLNRFKKRYLSTPESEWLIPDIIRYVCSLEFKREVTDDSKYLQRWELIRNLLLSIRSELVAQNAKLALYYDWIFFAQGRDQVFRLGMFLRLLHSITAEQS